MERRFAYRTPFGHDELVVCDTCASIRSRDEATSSKFVPDPEPALPVERVFTPGTETIDQLASLLDVPRHRTAKAMFVHAGRHRDGTAEELSVVAVVRGDTTLNEHKLATLLEAADLRPMTAPEILEIGAVAGYGSPIGVRHATVVADRLVMASPNLVAGANQPSWHLRHTNAPRDWQPDLVADIVNADVGDACPECARPLRADRAVILASIRALGTQPTAAAGAGYLDPTGAHAAVVMGSCRVALDELLDCAAEEHHDERGLRWPVALAPFPVHIAALHAGGQTVAPVAARLLDTLESAGIGALLDDRGERPGVQFADADLIGLPLRLTVSERSLAAGGIEVTLRHNGDRLVVAESGIADHVEAQLAALASLGSAGRGGTDGCEIPRGVRG
jgi:prolyl-tRNA synthetase